MTECLVNEDGGKMLACIDDLGDLDDESIGHMMFEELENNRPKQNLKPKSAFCIQLIDLLHKVL